MTVFKTDRFISAASAGADWRDAARRVLEGLQDGGTAGDGMTVGFLYVTDALAGDASNILALFKSVTGIKTWVGSVGLGVCGCGDEFIDQAAIAAMVGKIDADDFALLPPVDLNLTAAREGLEGWLDRHEPMLGLIHGDPMIETDPACVLAELGRFTGAFLAGGLSSSRGDHIQFAGEVAEGGMSGLLFSQNVQVSTALTQGCTPLGPSHTVTRCDGHMVLELDGQRAFEVFMRDLRAVVESQVESRIGHATGMGTVAVPSFAGMDCGGLSGPGANAVEHLFHGEIHVAFPVQGSDQNDYLVRNAIGIDPEEGHIAIAHEVTQGEQMMFVRRDDKAMQADLSRTLLDLRNRVIRERGSFAPQGALYISCLARAMGNFGGDPGHPGDLGGEMKLVRDVLGDIPMAGFYANGEISNHRLYGYTAIVILFH